MAQNLTPFSVSSYSDLFFSNSTAAPEAEDKSIVGNIVATLGAVILGLVFLLGCPGNLFIIWSILARARKRSVTTLLILSLAIADGFLMALTPFFLVYLARRTWEFGAPMCRLLYYLCCINMYASILLITLMSLYRLAAVVRPPCLNALAQRRNVLRILLALWVLVPAISVPPLVFREVMNSTDHSRKTHLCVPNHTPRHAVLQYTFETMVGFVIPYGVIVSSYVCILHRIRQTKFRRRMRSEKLILAIVVTFGLFWLPYHIINMVQVAAELCPDSPMKKRLERIWRSCRAVTSTLAFISSCANPVLYTLAGKAYMRQAGLAFMARLFEGTGLDSGTRRGRQTGENSQEKEGVGLSQKESDSLAGTSVNAGRI